MKKPNKLLMAGASLCLVYSAPSVSQDDSILIDEIVITGRKREESLQEVPISISVLGASLINDAGILDQQDLFDMTPGLHYDEEIDRNSALPSIRGVQSNEIATNRTKVTAFIDGMPILGSQGSIGFGNLQQVEIYRGPQSAAFGRSTFGGAINYITKDPGEEFEGSVNVNVSDYGTKIVGASFGGPVTDNFGYLVDLSYEDSSAPDEYIADDGTEYGARSGESISAKFVFNPTDELEVELAFSHVETADGPTAEYFLSGDARDACFDGTAVTGMDAGVYQTGTFSCDWSQGATIRAQNDRAAALAASGETDEDALFIAASQSLPESEVGSFDTRDRVTAQFDYALDSGAAFQVSAFYGEEDYVRGDGGAGDIGEVLSITADGDGTYTLDTGNLGTIMSDPTNIEEQYLEMRWVSPSDERFRYVVGGSYYNYDFLTNLYFGGYGAVLQGADAIARYDALLGNDGLTTSVGFPTQVFSETATNIGGFFNLTYDLTDRATLSFEGRYQSDDVGGTDTTSGESGSVDTKAFLPRLSLNYNVNDDMSFYGQISKGNNPGGVNVGFFNPSLIDVLDNGVDDGLDADGDGDSRSIYVTYDSDTFASFEEETLINYELGMKGSAFDGVFQYAAAIYMMDWSDQAQSVNLSWNDPTYVGAPVDFTENRTVINQGDLDMKGIEFEGTYLINDNWNVRATLGYLDATYADYCSVDGLNYVADDDSRIVAQSETNPYECLDVSGLDVYEQPELSGSLSPSYNADLGNTGLAWSARADILFESEEWLDQANIAKSEAVTTMNLSLGLNADNWSATLYINNLTDDDTPLQYSTDTDYTLAEDADILTATGDAQSNYLITPRAPRTIGLRASYNF